MICYIVRDVVILNYMYLLVILQQTNPKAADRILRIKKYDHKAVKLLYNLGSNNCFTMFNTDKTVNLHNEKKCNDTMRPQDARAIVSCFNHMLDEVMS